MFRVTHSNATAVAPLQNGCIARGKQLKRFHGTETHPELNLLESCLKRAARFLHGGGMIIRRKKLNLKVYHRHLNMDTEYRREGRKKNKKLVCSVVLVSVL